MPPSAINSPIGGRTSSKSAPRSRPAKGRGDKGRPPIGAPRRVGQIAGVPGIWREFHLAATIEVTDALRPGLEICVTALVCGSANHRLEISLRGSDIIRKTGFATLPGAGHPDRTGRRRGGAADAAG